MSYRLQTALMAGIVVALLAVPLAGTAPAQSYYGRSYYYPSRSSYYSPYSYSYSPYYSTPYYGSYYSTPYYGSYSSYPSYGYGYSSAYPYRSYSSYGVPGFYYHGTPGRGGHFHVGPFRIR